jgi:hypothetical protein
MIRLKDEKRSPVKGGRLGGESGSLKSARNRESGASLGSGSEKPEGEPTGGYYEPAARMQAPSFVKKFRRRIQGFLWNRAEKQGVADYLRMMDAERETTKRSLQKRPKEVRVLWVHEDATEQ